MKAHILKAMCNVLGVELAQLSEQLNLPTEALSAWLDGEGPPSNVDAALDNANALKDVAVAKRLYAELRTFADLVAKVADKEAELRKRSLPDNMAYRRAFSPVRDNSPQTIRLLSELRTRGFGKAITLRDLESGETVEYRIAQANYGFPKIGVISRLTPVAKALVPVRVGDEVQLPKGAYEVIEVSHLEPASHEVRAQPNFLRVDHKHDRLGNTLVRDAAASLASLVDHFIEAFRAGGAEGYDFTVEEREFTTGDMASLGTRFYTSTTALQEELLQLDSSGGLLVVHGVAGSGKTSVALGRTKVLCDRTDVDGEDDPSYFQPETARGYVLSSQLTSYLKRSCNKLALYDMPILEYRELRAQQVNLRRIDDDSFKAGGVPEDTNDSLVATMAWLRSAEQLMARDFASNLRHAVKDIPGAESSRRRRRATVERTAAQEASLAPVWADFAEAIEKICESLNDPSADYPTRGLVRRIDHHRRKLAERLEELPGWGRSSSSERTLQNRQLRQNLRSAARERIVRALRLSPAYARVVALPEFSSKLRQALGSDAEDRINVAISQARERLDDKKLCDEDIDILLSIGHLLSVGYRGRGDRDPISHLAEITYASQVFIDEYQDFGEVPLFLMGQTADPERRAVTIVGDLCQRLTKRSAPDLAACFPEAEANEVEPRTLVENLRQTKTLARLTQRFREIVMGSTVLDTRLPQTEKVGKAKLFLVPCEQHSDEVFKAVVEVARNRSLAVVCPTEEVAVELEEELREDLRTEYRESRVSVHTDLVRPFFVHFTTPTQAKGLEFDVVVVPFIDAFDLTDPVEANKCYVALSRPRNSLILIGSPALLDGPFSTLVKEELVEVNKE